MKQTVAGQVSARGHGGITILRISGPQALKVGQAFFKGRRTPRCGQHLYYGLWQPPESSSPLDEILLSAYSPAESPTGEELVEITCHGGPQVARAILDSLQHHGIKCLPPSQMLRYSLLGAGYDPICTRAYECLLTAHSRLAARWLLAQVQGALSRVLQHIQQHPEKPSAVCQLDALLELAPAGCALSFPWKVIIAGPPNSGKSTILNTLAGWSRVLVDDQPGTTRDAIETLVTLQGIPFIFVDTAGIRDTSDPIENLGVSKTQSQMTQAQIVLFVLDLSAPLISPDLVKIPSGVRRIVVFNKKDLAPTAIPHFRHHYSDGIPICARQPGGLAPLKEALLQPFQTLLSPSSWPLPLIFTPQLQRASALTRQALLQKEYRQAQDHLAAILNW